MRKLIILNTIIDFIWILSCIPILILGFGFIIYMFFNPEILEIWQTNGFDSNAPIWIKQFATVIFYGIACGLIFAVFLFRKTLCYFRRKKPFDSYVIESYNTIGKILIGLSLFSMVFMFMMQLVFNSKLVIDLGVSPYLLLLSLGLFFMVLSESFKIAKHAKNDSELTI
ncbi:DUF2975 domain-containing protein [Bizionia myxarmorum]|uniref:DUF2975 domain-containing protein n=1 Tax=Bizionia myxarmorum TaxID=291186 RepID=A0A5D0RCV1_9FLAO|nr:DUF2975 domain-containing protein [Bizionia myxarmorum]TYB78879.1 DUF2975 domain-containing protein [Bizionia myxarmorum]